MLKQETPDCEGVTIVADVEKALRRAWTTTLGGAEIQHNDDFFARGGDSITVHEAAARLAQDLNVRVDPAILYEHSRFGDALSALHQLLGSRQPADGPVAAGPRLGTHPLSFQQEALLAWSDRFAGRHHHDLLYSVSIPPGVVDPGRLRDAVAAAGERHPALRTSVYGNQQHVTNREFVLEALPHSAGGLIAAARDWAAQGFTLDGPLARISYGGDDHSDLLVLSAHQLVMDQWSWGVLLRDIAAFYDDPDRTPPLAPAYSDYARWQTEHVVGAKYARHLEFWRQLADGAPRSGVPLPGAPADAEAAGPASSLPLIIRASLARQLKAAAQTLRVPLFHVLLAAFHAALADWVGCPDVIIGSATANRDINTEDTVGFFVNGRFTRTPVSARTAADLITQISAGWRASDAHRDLHLEKLVFDLDTPDLVNVKVSLNALLPLSALPEIAGHEMRAVNVAVTDSARRHLAVAFTPSGTGYTGTAVYRTDVVEGQAVNLLLDRFQRVLEQVAVSPDAPISASL